MVVTEFLSEVSNPTLVIPACEIVTAFFWPQCQG